MLDVWHAKQCPSLLALDGDIVIRGFGLPSADCGLIRLFGVGAIGCGGGGITSCGPGDGSCGNAIVVVAVIVGPSVRARCVVSLPLVVDAATAATAPLANPTAASATVTATPPTAAPITEETPRAFTALAFHVANWSMYVLFHSSRNCWSHWLE